MVISMTGYDHSSFNTQYRGKCLVQNAGAGLYELVLMHEFITSKDIMHQDSWFRKR